MYSHSFSPVNKIVSRLVQFIELLSVTLALSQLAQSFALSQLAQSFALSQLAQSFFALLVS